MTRGAFPPRALALAPSYLKFNTSLKNYVLLSNNQLLSFVYLQYKSNYFREDDCPILYALEESQDALNYNSTLDNSTIGEGFEETNSTDTSCSSLKFLFSRLTLSIPAVEALDKFTTWLRTHDQYLPKHDHAILITKFDLLSPRGDSYTQGMAYVGNICKKGDSASIVEDIGAAATAVIAGILSGPRFVRSGSRDLCARVWCKDRTKRRSEPCETKTYFPALDGTECGRTKWCIAGQCVDNPKRIRECSDLNEKMCRKYSKAKLRHYCKATDFKEICCRSCEQLKDL
ncbi:unnamed protein product [Haemonchus placei]|uniref:ADAM_CR_2 domain-containing protein n=1 Tax=Haemonchus placei TaxID=6290 RepID=A0A0N4XB41_HAEPC|nr:unnamed protein product [Haemonchus placei]